MALSETSHYGNFIISEANGTFSREEVTIASGQDLEDGTVLGIVSASGHYAVYNAGASDGTQTVAGILIGNVDASSAAKAATILKRDAEVKTDGLTWFTGATSKQITTGIAALLSTLRIVCR